MNVNEVIQRITKLQLNGEDLRAQAYNEALMAAIHIVESQGRTHLNKNQQRMLQEVIKQYDITKPKTVLHALEHLSMIAFLLDEMDEVTEEDCIMVAQVFLDWALKQEDV